MRGALVELRNRGRLRPELLRVIERDLDLQEARLGEAGPGPWTDSGRTASSAGRTERFPCS